MDTIIHHMIEDALILYASLPSITLVQKLNQYTESTACTFWWQLGLYFSRYFALFIFRSGYITDDWTVNLLSDASLCPARAR